ncbi:MAG: phosphodiester glycosidase family protein [Clostridia bacterium]
MKNLLALFLCLLLLLPLDQVQAAAGAQLPPDQLMLDERGFLPRDSGQEEYLWEDAENGLWQYATLSLFIRVRRMENDSPLIWLETEVRTSPESPLMACLTKGKRPGRKLSNPLKLAKENRLVLAITDDFSGVRIQKKQTTGIVIRNGVILGKKTHKGKRGWPNLDTLAVLGDGSLKASACDAYTVQEAINLDGGGTAALMFMGKVLNRSSANMRSVNSLIGFGQSDLVPQE